MTRNCPLIASIYFDEMNRDKAVDLYHPVNSDEKEKLWKILQNFSLTCRLANCTCKLDPEAVEMFCRQASHFHITSFEEAYNTGVLHCGWAHLGNNLFGLIKLIYEIYHVLFWHVLKNSTILLKTPLYTHLLCEPAMRIITNYHF